MSKRAVLCLILLALVFAAMAGARSRKRSRSAHSGTPGQFDYYLLSLSWAPDFCDRPDVNKNSRECGRGNHVGFIVHGLWPQFDNGGYPEQCAPASPVASGIVNQMLPLMMDAGLIQHEWRDHGTCSGLSAADFFGQVQRAYNSVTIPDRYKNLSQAIQVSPGDVHRDFASANPSFPNDAFRVACGGNEVSEVRVCFTKDLQPRACSTNDKECSAGELQMLPLR
ncbi:MAG: ribonuclease T2 [Acidobacteriaceae bacterium]|nr:ribonuclease T2 [Acidobacteriaceae bacterium]